MNLAARFDHTFRTEVIVASIVFGMVLLVFVAALIRSATARGKRASQKTSYKKTEAAYVSVVAVVAAGLITFSLTQNTSPHPKPSMTVRVTGYQWCWRFAYQGTKVSVTADCVSGHIPTLVVPTGEPIRFDVTSADVIHSMWIPALRYKLFAYPNFVNSFETTFPRVGRWDAQCAEFCGEYHYAMHFILQVMPPAQFQNWLRDEEASAP